MKNHVCLFENSSNGSTDNVKIVKFKKMFEMRKIFRDVTDFRNKESNSVKVVIVSVTTFLFLEKMVIRKKNIMSIIYSRRSCNIEYNTNTKLNNNIRVDKYNKNHINKDNIKISTIVKKYNQKTNSRTVL